MLIFQAVLGVVVLFFGHRLFWFAIGIIGFLLGVQIAGELMADSTPVIQLLAALVVGIIGGTLAVVFQRVAFVIGGFLAGVYLTYGIALGFDIDPNVRLLWSAIGGGVAGLIAALLMDWAIIVLTALVGAVAIAGAFGLSAGASALLFVVCASAGIAFQSWRFSMEPSKSP